jgi:hypothetical protein
MSTLQEVSPQAFEAELQAIRDNKRKDPMAEVTNGYGKGGRSPTVSAAGNGVLDYASLGSSPIGATSAEKFRAERTAVAARADAAFDADRKKPQTLSLFEHWLSNAFIFIGILMIPYGMMFMGGDQPVQGIVCWGLALLFWIISLLITINARLRYLALKK